MLFLCLQWVDLFMEFKANNDPGCTAALMYVGSSPQPVFSEYQCDYSPSWIDSILTH